MTVTAVGFPRPLEGASVILHYRNWLGPQVDSVEVHMSCALPTHFDLRRTSATTASGPIMVDQVTSFAMTELRLYFEREIERFFFESQPHPNLTVAAGSGAPSLRLNGEPTPVLLHDKVPGRRALDDFNWDKEQDLRAANHTIQVAVTTRTNQGLKALVRLTYKDSGREAPPPEGAYVRASILAPDGRVAAQGVLNGTAWVRELEVDWPAPGTWRVLFDLDPGPRDGCGFGGCPSDRVRSVYLRVGLDY